jgi:chorismate lyase
VKTNTITYATRQDWLNEPIGSGLYRKWLIDNGSLTARLKSHYDDFNLMPLKSVHEKAHLDEWAVFNMANYQHVLIREVLLSGKGKPAVFAHSVIPLNSLHGQWIGLGRLGNKPLGAALFANPNVTRTPLQFKKITKQHPLYRKAIAHSNEKPNALWARRSVFNLNCAKILVTEVFLPHISYE